jgi:hypothetical protein
VKGSSRAIITWRTSKAPSFPLRGQLCSRLGIVFCRATGDCGAERFGDGTVVKMDELPHALPAKRAKLDPGEGHVRAVDGMRRKNVVEMDGKSCLHEVAWPPGTYALVYGSMGGGAWVWSRDSANRFFTWHATGSGSGLSHPIGPGARRWGWYCFFPRWRGFRRSLDSAAWPGSV